MCDHLEGDLSAEVLAGRSITACERSVIWRQPARSPDEICSEWPHPYMLELILNRDELALVGSISVLCPEYGIREQG